LNKKLIFSQYANLIDHSLNTHSILEVPCLSYLLKQTCAYSQTSKIFEIVRNFVSQSPPYYNEKKTIHSLTAFVICPFSRDGLNRLYERHVRPYDVTI